MVSCLEINPYTVIYPGPLVGKNGAGGYGRESTEITSPEQLNSALARIAGSKLHAALAEAQRRRLTSEDLSLPGVTSELWSDSSDFFDITLHPEFNSNGQTEQLVSDTVNWLTQITPFPLPNLPITAELYEDFQTQWNQVTEFSSLTTALFLEKHPYYQSENCLVLPEVAIYPQTYYLEKLIQLLQQPSNESFSFQSFMGFLNQDEKEKRGLQRHHLNIYRAFGIQPDSPDLQDLLYRVLVQDINPFDTEEPLASLAFKLGCSPQGLERFFLDNSLVDICDQLNQFLIENNHDNYLSGEEIERFLVARILMKARDEMRLLIGGQPDLIKDKDYLYRLLRDFPLKNFKNSKAREEFIDNLPVEDKSIFSPLSIRLDQLIITLEPFRENGPLTREQKEFLQDLKHHVRQVYQRYKNPALFQDLDFLVLLDHGAREHNLKILIGDFKTSIFNPAPLDLSPKHLKEMLFYFLAVEQQIMAFRILHPRLGDKEESPYGDMLNDPLLEAFNGALVTYIHSVFSNGRLIPHIRIFRAFDKVTNPDGITRGQLETLRQNMLQAILLRHYEEQEEQSQTI